MAEPLSITIVTPTLNAALFAQELNLAVPRTHVDFLRSFYDSFKVGDYLFVHAGIRPGIAVEDQDPHDLRWIRRDFLDSNMRHEAVVVHGVRADECGELLTSFFASLRR